MKQRTLSGCDQNFNTQQPSPPRRGTSCPRLGSKLLEECTRIRLDARPNFEHVGCRREVARNRVIHILYCAQSLTTITAHTPKEARSLAPRRIPLRTTCAVYWEIMSGSVGKSFSSCLLLMVVPPTEGGKVESVYRPSVDAQRLKRSIVRWEIWLGYLRRLMHR